MIKKFFILLITILFFSPFLKAQVVINEYLSSNISGITDEDNDYSDWIEFYNNSEQSVDLKGYKISDSEKDTIGWVFPEVVMPAHSFLTVFASGKDKNGIAPKFNTIITQGDTWKYIVPTGTMSANWRTLGFNDSSWSSGKSGFGYGDNDDATILENCNMVLIRKEFEIENVNSITSMLLHVDYDDGFIAFINGKMVAMGGIAEYNYDYSIIQAVGHEALMFNGGNPEEFNISSFISLMKDGKNVIAIQGHNNEHGSSDFTLIPFLTIASPNFTSNNAASFISVEDGNRHTNFKIDKAGETLYLYNAEAVLIDSSKAVALEDDISYGRYEDGSDRWYFFKQPTPGSSNINPLDSIKRDSVLFSHQAGFYNQPVELTITSSSVDAGSIRYTTDGSLPTANSSLYSTPIMVSTTTVVRAAIVTDGGVSNQVSTRTFIFDDSNGLPVISISTDPENLFDWEEGIYMLGPNAETENPNFGANFWQDWEKPINFEFFDQQNIQRINQGAGIKIAGNWSRANAQKSMALYARKSYGKGSFNYKFFQDRENDSFESILIRNSGNDWSYTMFRDGLVSEIARDMDMERLAFQPAKIFLNGEYWGILNIREKPSEHYFEENFGVDEDNVNILENEGDIVVGKSTDYAILRNFINSKPLTSDENYRQVCEMMDISCFIDYQILEIYVDNGDWPGNNIKYWKTNDPLSKWRWLIFDTDFGFNLFGSNGNTLTFATTTQGSSWPNPPWSTLFLRKLLTNEEFKNSFVNRFSDCLNSNLMEDELLPKTDSVQNLIMPEIEYHLTRWDFSYDRWLYEVERIDNFISTRKLAMRTYIRNFFGFDLDHVITLALSDNQAGRIKINTIIPANFPFQGYYFREVPISLSAIPNPGYRFVRWEGGSSSTNLNIAVSLASNTTFRAVFEPTTEEEQLVVINEINYKSPDNVDAGDWIELYNNGRQTVDLSGWVIHDGDPASGFDFPQGLLLYPNEYLVIAGNLSKFGTFFPTVRNVTGAFPFGLSSSGDVIYLYNKEGALVDKVNYGVQSPWPVDPCGLGPTLELENPGNDNELAANWTAGKNGGTPGKQNSIFVNSQTIANSKFNASCFPTAFADYTTLQFYSNKGNNYSIQLIDMQGKIHEQIEGFTNAEGISSINLFVNEPQYKAGIYLVRVKTDENVQTVKVIKR